MAESWIIGYELTAQAAQIGTAGTPNVVAAPVRSMFQTDSTAIRAHRFVNWSRRRATAVALLSGVAWGEAEDDTP